MRQFSGFKAEKASSGREILPAGGYVCEIKSAKEEEFDWGSRLALAIDVVEGEYAGFFKKDFDGNDREDKKWRGIYRISIPKDDGSEIYCMGHPEYDRYTLDSEYKRDTLKGINPEIPINYYPENNPENKPLMLWRSHSMLIYSNWLNYYVYQVTPYEL